MENPEEILPEILSTLFMTTSPATELESLQLIHKQLWLLSSVHDKNVSDFDIKLKYFFWIFHTSRHAYLIVQNDIKNKS
jgi:hypothetical protein